MRTSTQELLKKAEINFNLLCEMGRVESTDPANKGIKKDIKKYLKLHSKLTLKIKISKLEDIKDKMLSANIGISALDNKEYKDLTKKINLLKGAK